jgi:outer membrane lipoprotein SlyB
MLGGFLYPPATMRTEARLLLVLLALPSVVAACGDRFSPDTYATRAVQQADKVEQGIVVGVRPVRISADGTVGAATGAAAGGVLGRRRRRGGSSRRWAVSAARWSAG